MNKRLVMMVSVVVFSCCLLFPCTNARADVDWKILKKLRIQEKPLDVDVSLDGQYLYILVEGKLIVYSLAEGKGKYVIPVNKSFDRLRFSETTRSFILLSTSENSIEIFHLQFIQQFDVSGSPFLGSQKAPITVCAFIEYR